METVRETLQKELKVKVSPIEIPIIRRTSGSGEEERLQEAISLFQFLADCLDEFPPDVLRDSIAILDLPFNSQTIPSELNPVSAINHPECFLASMLALAFPEVQWVFPLYYPHSGDKYPYTISFPFKLQEELKELLIKPCALFDASGLRDKIKENMQRTKECPHITQRDKVSASIDEEKPYCFLHSYIAYRLGYRVHPIVTYEAMRGILGEDSEEKVEMVFEDLFLNFPDKPPAVHLSNLEERDKKFSRLGEVQKRFLITVGHRHYGYEEENREYIEKLRGEEKKVRKIYKPTGGFFNILQSAGLLDDFWTRVKEDEMATKPQVEQEGGHSSPGRLLIVAERLIARAEKLLESATSVEDCIHGAVLALEAKELLGYKTPTTSLEAIALRHQLEVKAECMFYGVEYNIDVGNRLKEIEREVDMVARWFHSSIKTRASLDAKMSIVTEVMRIFAEAGQFDEEEECLRFLRKLRRGWAFQTKGIAGLGLKVIHPVRWYVEKLVDSFPLFLTVLLFWPALFALLSLWLVKEFSQSQGPPSWSFKHHFLQSWSTFYGLQPPNFLYSTPGIILTIFLILIGFIHLGVFISYLYTLLTRGRR